MVGNWALGQGPWALAQWAHRPRPMGPAHRPRPMGPFRRPTVVRTAVRPPDRRPPARGAQALGPGVQI